MRAVHKRYVTDALVLVVINSSTIHVTCFGVRVLVVYLFKSLFINTSDSFAIPIGGERVTWVCINLCL